MFCFFIYNNILKILKILIPLVVNPRVLPLTKTFSDCITSFITILIGQAQMISSAIVCVCEDLGHLKWSNIILSTKISMYCI